MPKKVAKKSTKQAVKRTGPQWSFTGVVDSVSRLHTEFQRQSAKAVNVNLTLRNWLIGAYIHELGHGFCFEGRQKRILVDGEYFFVDLVFYHRILRCHVLFELKTTDFKPDYMGQLHTYVNWCRENMMTEHDQPPVGILLCSGKSEALVKYATAGLDNKVFVSRYLAQLSTQEELLRITRDM